MCRTASNSGVLTVASEQACPLGSCLCACGCVWESLGRGAEGGASGPPMPCLPPGGLLGSRARARHKTDPSGETPGQNHIDGRVFRDLPQGATKGISGSEVLRWAELSGPGPGCRGPGGSDPGSRWGFRPCLAGWRRLAVTGGTAAFSHVLGVPGPPPPCEWAGSAFAVPRTVLACAL